VAVSYAAQRYHAELGRLIEIGGLWGAAGFIALTAIFVVFVIPLDIAFLIPLGTAAFGPVATALMSITGWTIGAAAAFGIARWYGQPVVGRLVSLERIRDTQARIPKGNLFLSVMLLRMLVPVDLLSYALGLFSEMRWGGYLAATALGVSPFGFYFAYAGALPLVYRIAAITAALVFASLILWRYARR
jgi:uncharacterized membrane protein YdjX (TVP38/TMEM64 family)